MKKLLIGTTALVAAGTIVTGAQAAEKIKISVGGYFLAYLVAGDQDDGAGQPGAGRRQYDIEREGEIIFNGRTKLDNGITVGVQVQLEAETCTDQIDETFIYFSGGFGRLVIGSENSAAYLMAYGTPAPSHWAHGLNSPGFRHVSPGKNTTSAFQSSRHQMSGDAEKITYFTPVFGGFRIGASFTPDNQEAGNSNGTIPVDTDNDGRNKDGTDKDDLFDADSNRAKLPANFDKNKANTLNGGSYGGFSSAAQTGQQSNVIEIAAEFRRKFGNFGMTAVIGFGRGDREGPATAGKGDRTEWSVGGGISFSGVTIGASYRNDDVGFTGNNNEQHHFATGVRYARGAWGVGIQYALRYNEAATTGTDAAHEYNAVEVGGSYNLGPGVNINAGVQWHDLDDNAATTSGDNEAIIFFIGTALSF